MRRLFLSLAVIGLTLVGFTSCDKEETNVVDTSEVLYTGSIDVTFRGENVTTEGIECAYNFNDENTLNITLKNIKFVPQMPLTITPVLSNIPYTKAKANDGSEVIHFEAPSIVPTLGGNPYEDYTATNIEGKIEGNTIDFSLSFGTYPTHYLGNKN